MIISRTIARRRIAAKQRPSWFGAWGLVGLDALALIVIFALLWSPFQTLTATFNFPTWATAAALFAVGFIPMQAVLILSSLWAAKSRWDDGDAGKSGK